MCSRREGSRLGESLLARRIMAMTWRLNLFFPAAAFLAGYAACSESYAAALPEPATVFASGQEGYASYRIPTLAVTKGGSLLALCEGRTRNDDNAANDLVLK